VHLLVPLKAGARRSPLNTTTSAFVQSPRNPEAPLTVQTTVADRATVSPMIDSNQALAEVRQEVGAEQFLHMKSAPPECLRFVGEFIRDELQNVGAGRSLLASRRGSKRSHIDLRHFRCFH
jgi:hypothetical protein